LENPVDSVLPKVQPLASVLSYLQVVRSVTWLGSAHPQSLWHCIENRMRLFGLIQFMLLL
jgi:hypothetical protein